MRENKSTGQIQYVACQFATSVLFFSFPAAHHRDFIMFTREMNEGMEVILFSVP